MIDDGLQTSTELRVLKEFWKIDSEKDPKGRLWDSKMLGLFTTGVSVKVNRYPKDNGREARMVYQAGRHNVDNNKLRFTSVATIVQVGMSALAKCEGKKAQAEKFLLAQYGKGSCSVSRTWVIAGSCFFDPPQ